MSPPHAGPFRECRHLFARHPCRFHERARRSRALPETVNFGGGSNPHLVRPAWIDAAPRPPAPPRKRWRAWALDFARALGRWLRSQMEQEPGFGPPWMASEAIAGGEPRWL